VREERAEECVCGRENLPPTEKRERRGKLATQKLTLSTPPHTLSLTTRNLTGRPVVFPAHMEIATPTVADAVASAVAAGASRVVIAPYFLSDGRHMSEDIPALAAAAAAANASALPGGVVVARALGGDAALARLLDSRVEDALGGVEGA
jgi:sirohydrochlorin ferrochelatase